MAKASCGVEESPQSQRATLPSPQPFPCVTPRVKSPGAYRILNEEPVGEEPIDESPSTRRAGR